MPEGHNGKFATNKEFFEYQVENNERHHQSQIKTRDRIEAVEKNLILHIDSKLQVLDKCPAYQNQVDNNKDEIGKLRSKSNRWDVVNSGLIAVATWLGLTN